MFTDENVLQSELISLRNKIKVFEEILNEDLRDKQYEFTEIEFNMIYKILKKYKHHFDL